MEQQTVKLYTEEQVREAFTKGIRYASSIHLASFSEQYKYIDKIIDLLTPIELPSDENIEEKAEFLFPTVNRMGGTTYIAHKSFIEGAKWMKDKILNQNK